MTSNEIGPIIVIVLFIIGLIIFSVRASRISYVKSNSILIGELRSLNSEFTFIKIREYTKYYFAHDTKRKFDRDSPYDFMNRHVYENLNSYKDLTNKISINLSMYNNYLDSYDNLRDFNGQVPDNSKLKEKVFIKYEEMLYRSMKFNSPTTNFFVEYYITYTSPKGQNHYKDCAEYPMNIIEQNIYEIEVDIKKKKTRQYRIKAERSIMTDSKRYEIMKRDNFKCKICGSSANDGVKLHVDHIYPVSRGGKSTNDNLQTLCDRCNMGKSDKI